MKIVVAGAGEVGFNLIENLSKEDLDISVIDINGSVLERLRDSYGVNTDHSNIVDSRFLSPSYLKDADLFLAITNSDETNMIACKLASDAGAKKTICRIRRVDLSSANKHFSLNSLGIDWVINPVSLVADELIRILLTPNIVDSHEFLDGDVMMTGYRMTEYSRIIGRKIGDLEKSMSKNQVQIVIIQRKNISFIPHKDDVIKYGDIVYFVYRAKDFMPLRRVLGYAQKQAKAKRIFINGGGNIGLSLAERLEAEKHDVKIIERNLARSYQIAEKLQKSLVLNFDGTDRSQLIAEGIEDADFFISVTDNEQTNLTSCLLANEQDVESTICLVQQPELIQIIDQKTPISLGISPRIISARYLVQFIQGTNVSSYFSLVNSQLEVLEVHLGANAKYLNTALKDIILPENVRVGIIKRNEDYLRANGDSKLKAGDIILLILHRFDRNKALEFFA